MTSHFEWVTKVYISSFKSVLQTLKIVSNIISQGPRMVTCSAIFFIWNSQISLFRHLPLTLKSPINTNHNPSFLLIFPLFYCNFSFRNALLSTFGNANSTL
jgi:hypothetical protein